MKTENTPEQNEPMLLCNDCNEAVPADEAKYINDHDICDDCAEHYITCHTCDAQEHEDNFTFQCIGEGRHEGIYCMDCISDNFFCCDDCSEHCHNDEGTSTEAGENICRDCRDDNYFYCDVCDGYLHTDNYGDNGLCTEHARDESLGAIKNYSFKPKPEFFKVANETKFFGIELEVEKHESDTERGDMAEKIAMPELYFKEDGSLTEGFEIVSHPLSYEYIKTNSLKFTNMLGKLTKAGYRSYNTDTCGIHIHISKSAFNTWHLYRFMKFFSENKIFILKVSQRIKENLERWAKLDDANKKLLLAKIKGEQEGRYQAINLLNAATVEIRIFRGTLNAASFFKNIEFIEALYQFTLSFPADKITLPTFLAYVEENKEEYTNLHKFLNDHNYKTNKL